MPLISTIFNGAAHVTVSGCLAAFLFKRTIVDRTSKAIKEAENVTAGLVASELCFSMAVLILASHKTARILLSNDTNLAPLATNDKSDLSAAFSVSSNYSSTSTPTDSTTPSSLLPLSPIQRPKRLSIDSDVTLVDNDDDFAGDPPGTSEQLDYINELEKLHSELLVDQATLVDGWAAAMAQLGLTSMLSPEPPLPHQKTPTLGNSTDIFQD